jgi:dipeptidyl aminopeptidase/acylaminoacyl peptidase
MNPRSVAPAALVLLLFPGAVPAADVYQQPPPPIAQILDAAPSPQVRVSPDRSWLLVLEPPALPPLADLTAPELRLAGLRLSPRTNGPSRDSGFTGLRLVSVAGGKERRLEVPAKTRLGNVTWSPDSARVAFTVTSENGIALWLAEASTGATRALTEPRLNALGGPPCRWVSARDGLACRLVPPTRGAAPTGVETPSGPVVQETAGKATPGRTYQDLLQGPSDEAPFEHYLASQITLVSLDGRATPVGEPSLHLDAEPSPDGQYLQVETLHRPFSYLVPFRRFPRRIEVWDRSGKLVHRLADLPLQEDASTSFDAVAPGPRDVAWRADAPATLAWTEALDGGDPAKPAAKRDRVALLAAPFKGTSATVLEVEYRVDDVTWARGDLALVRESWFKTRRTRTWLVAPDRPGQAPRALFDRSSEDRYGDPGAFLDRATPAGTSVLLTSADGRSAYLDGDGASPEGDRPFLDRLDLATGRSQRLWRSEAPQYEFVVAVLDDAGRRIVTRRESVDAPPNFFVRDLAGKSLDRLTDFPDPAPVLKGVKPELIRYRRADGVELTARLYVPPGYQPSQGPLPFLFWAYPEEFKSAAAASQVSGSPFRFTRPTGASHLLVLTQGYGVLDNPSMPIVGEGDKEPNDTYVEQLVSSAQAAVDEVVRRGVADRGRIAVGGHSYGAFMTANLLAHSDLFRAGIARSGAYNRTLTPFGFQAEERPFWKARDVYIRMSPFTYADRINEPILLIHGAADDNSGTFPIQSERLYAALKGNGARARLVMLPAEAHGYRARESVGHTLWEMVHWLDTYVKPTAPATAE